MDDLSDEELSDEETEEHKTVNTSDDSKRILTNNIPPPKADFGEKGADENRDNSCANNDQDVVENGSITPPAEMENVASDKDKSSGVNEGKDVTHGDKTDTTLLPSSQNGTSPTENGNSGEKGTTEKSKSTEEVTFEVGCQYLCVYVLLYHNSQLTLKNTPQLKS